MRKCTAQFKRAHCYLLVMHYFAPVIRTLKYVVWPRLNVNVLYNQNAFRANNNRWIRIAFKKKGKKQENRRSVLTCKVDKCFVRFGAWTLARRIVGMWSCWIWKMTFFCGACTFLNIVQIPIWLVRCCRRSKLTPYGKPKSLRVVFICYHFGFSSYFSCCRYFP